MSEFSEIIKKGFFKKTFRMTFNQVPNFFNLIICISRQWLKICVKDIDVP